MMRDERGLSESLQLAVLLPVVLAAFFGMLALGSVHHGRTVAREAAAMAAEDVGRGASPDQARDGVARMATASGLEQVSVVFVNVGNDVEVTVSGQMPAFVDAAPVPISASARFPKEPR